MSEEQIIKYTKKFGINTFKQQEGRPSRVVVDKESLSNVNTTPAKTGREKTRNEER